MMTFEKAIQLQLGEFDRKVQQLLELAVRGSPSTEKLSILSHGLDRTVQDIWELRNMKQRAEELVPIIGGVLYRTLGPTDVIQDGDEYSVESAMDKWKPCASRMIGRSVFDQNLIGGAGKIFRRKVEPAPSEYRALEPTERIREGDEYSDEIPTKWKPCSGPMIGRFVSDQNYLGGYGNSFRRRV